MGASNITSLTDVINIIGLTLTIIGLGIAIHQIRKTKKAADAAADAAKRTQETIKQNVALSDVSICRRIIEEIKTSIRNESFESAMLRTTDLLSQLIQLRYLHDSTKENISVDFKNAIAQLSIIQELSESRIRNGNNVINTKRCNRELSLISKQLNDWLGSKKFSITKGA